MVQKNPSHLLSPFICGIHLGLLPNRLLLKTVKWKLCDFGIGGKGKSHFSVCMLLTYPVYSWKEQDC